MPFWAYENEGEINMFQIVEKRSLNPSMTLMVVKAPYIAKKAKAGQFIILRVNEKGERIPLTIADYDREVGTVTIIFQIVGKTTMMLNQLNKGDAILDFIGPLGKASELEGHKHVAVIGGGAGCAIAYPQAKALHAMGTTVDMIAGFRNTDLIILEDEMRAASEHLYLMTEDGSNGHKGFVTEILDLDKYDTVLCCGPEVMMKRVVEMCKEKQVKVYVSMEKHMACGVGACLVCTCKTKDGNKRTCKDGPVFDGYYVEL